MSDSQQLPDDAIRLPVHPGGYSRVAMSESDLEARLAFYLRLNDTIPAPEREYRFHPQRRWRLDFAWPEQRVALEVQGGIHMAKSGHNTAAGITRDCEKANEAVVLGWKVLHVTREQIENGSAINWLRQILPPAGGGATWK